MFKNKVISVLMVVVLTVLSTFVVYGAEDVDCKVGYNASIYSYLVQTFEDSYNETGFKVGYKGIEEVVFMDLDANSIDKYLDINNEVYNKLILDVVTGELKEISLRGSYDKDKYILIGYVHTSNKTMYVKDVFLDLVNKAKDLQSERQKTNINNDLKYVYVCSIVSVILIIWFTLDSLLSKIADKSTKLYKVLDRLTIISNFVVLISIVIGTVFMVFNLFLDINSHTTLYDYLHTNLKDSLKLLQI